MARIENVQIKQINVRETIELQHKMTCFIILG